MSTTNVTSLFIQPGTLNVGIGTSQPRAKLEVAGSIVPSSNVVYDLGSATLRWRDLYLSGNSINLGGTTISRDATTGGIKFIDPATNQPLDSTVRNLTASNLTVLGDYVTLNTITSNTEQMVIQNAGTGPALKVTQTGANSIAEFYDDGNALALKIADGGNVGIGTAHPQAKLQVLGDVLVGTFGGILLKDFEGTVGNRNSQIMFVEDDPIRNYGFSLYYNGHNTINANSLGVNTLGILRHNNDPIGIPSMVINRSDGSIGIGTTIPLAKLHIVGSLLVSPIGSASDPMIGVSDLHGKSPGLYYLRWHNGIVSQHSWDGLWLKVHDEGLNANLFTSYWSDPTVTTMTQFGGFGSGYGHGWPTTQVGVPAAQNNILTISNLPSHSFARYFVRWHFVDSVDNESSQLRIYDIHQRDSYEVFWTANKSYPTEPSPNTTFFNTKATWSGAATYSVAPWPTASVDGYVSIDTNTFWHTTHDFRANHFTGVDQPQDDEAVYYTHSTLYIR